MTREWTIKEVHVHEVLGEVFMALGPTPKGVPLMPSDPTEMVPVRELRPGDETPWYRVVDEPVPDEKFGAGGWSLLAAHFDLDGGESRIGGPPDELVPVLKRQPLDVGCAGSDG